MTAKRIATASLVAVIVGLCALLTSACEQTSSLASSSQETTPVPVSLLYEGISNLRYLDEAEDWEGYPSPPFFGKITRKKGPAIQFHVQKHKFKKDDFVECKFDDEAVVDSLHIGDLVLVVGVLDEAFPEGIGGMGRELFLSDYEAIKFKHCELLPFTTE